jgi:hypothetical protein
VTSNGTEVLTAGKGAGGGGMDVENKVDEVDEVDDDSAGSVELVEEEDDEEEEEDDDDSLRNNTVNLVCNSALLPP